MVSRRIQALLLAEYWVPLLILTIFGLYHGSITFVNHQQFYTNAYDLGYYTHTVYEFGHLRLGEHVMEQAPYWHTFGDHFEPILFLFGPLVHLLGNYTLLVVQWAAILIGAIGAYRYFKDRTEDTWFPPMAMAQFLAIWGNSSALSFDFHAVVLGAMAVPWMLFHLCRGNRTWFVITLLLFVSSGEKVAFWGIVMFIGFALLHLRKREIVLTSLLASGFCLLWFWISMQWVIPHFLRPGVEYRHFAFKALGNTPGEAVHNVAADPIRAIRMLFESHTPTLGYTLGVKVEFWKMLALSGGIGLLRRPQYLLILMPILLGKLYNDYTVRWGINYHYSIEFVPILCIAIYEWVKDIPWQTLRRIVGVLVLLLTLTSSLVSLFNRCRLDYRPVTTNVFMAEHWKRTDYDLQNVRHAISLVPPDAPVSASDRIVPHIPPRKKIYFFPYMGEDTEYAVIQLLVDTYPLPQDEAAIWRDKMLASGGWRMVWSAREVAVLQRVHD